MRQVRTSDRKTGVAAVRAAKAKGEPEPRHLDLLKFPEMTERREGEQQFFNRSTLPRPGDG